MSKAVGPAVVRHRVSRRLRHVCARLAPDVCADVDVVVRALPGAAAASSLQLSTQVRTGLAKIGMIVGERA